MARTADEIVQIWKTKAELEIKDGKLARAGATRTAQKLRALIVLVRSDLKIFIEEEEGEPFALSQIDLDALELLLKQRPPPQRVQKKVFAAQLPAAPAELQGRCYHRAMATRSVAASKLGEAHELTLALGFHQALEQTQQAIAAELEKQRRVILQKDEAGRDLPGAAANRTALKNAGLSESYAKRKIEPLTKELAPYLKLKAPVAGPPESLPLWERTAVLAAKDFLSAAERVFDDPRRVLKYRNAQPLSQAGRFTKRALAKREQAKAKKAERQKTGT